MMKGPYSILKKCLYNQEVNSYLFEYGKQFLSTYSDQPKYIELEFLDGHEGTGDAIQHFDDPLRNFLDYLDSNEMVFLLDLFVLVKRLSYSTTL